MVRLWGDQPVRNLLLGLDLIILLLIDLPRDGLEGLFKFHLVLERQREEESVVIINHMLV